MSNRIATEKYCQDLGGKYFNPSVYNLELAVPEEYQQDLSASVLYCPINGDSTTVTGIVYRQVYYMNTAGQLVKLGGLYIPFNGNVYSGYKIPLQYDIDRGGTTFCDVTISIMGADLTCATKDDAVSFGCEVVNESSYTDDQLIPQVEVSKMSTCTVKYNRNYLFLNEQGRYSRYTRTIRQFSDTAGFYYSSSIPEQTVSQQNTQYANIKGSSCKIKLQNNPDLQDLTVTPLLIQSVQVISESTGEVLAEGTLPLVFTLSENCWVKFTGSALSLNCDPPIFVGDDEDQSLDKLTLGQVAIVDTLDSNTGTTILEVSDGLAYASDMFFTPGLHQKYLYFYTSNYYAIYNTDPTQTVIYSPLLTNSETGVSYDCGRPVQTETSGGSTPVGGSVVLRPINKSWYALPQDLPMTGHYTIMWMIRSVNNPSISVITPKTQRTLTIIDKGVGNITVNDVPYTQPIVYEASTQANIDWDGKADVEVRTQFATNKYEKYTSLTTTVVVDTTVTLTPAKSPTCEYSTINDTKLSFVSNRWENNQGITTHKYIEERDLYELYTQTDQIYSANRGAFKGNVEVQTVKCFSGCSTGTFQVPEYCYQNCTGLTSAQFEVPSSMSITYGARAFELCSALKTVTLSDNITSFGEGCFSQSGITSFTCPSGITKIPNQLCYSCGSLSTANLSAATALTSIGEEAFAAGTAYVYGSYVNPSTGTLEIVAVPVTQSSLISVHIPKSVSSLGKKAFANNYLLEIIDTNPVTGSLLTGNGRLHFIVDSSTFKSSLTSIPERGFAFCNGLKSVSLPASVTTLGTYAFYGTNNLRYFQAPGLTYMYAEALKGRCESDIKLSDCTQVGSLYKEEQSEGIYFTKAPLNNQAGLTTEYPFEIYIKPNKNVDQYILYKLHPRQFGASTLQATRCDTTILPGTLSIAPYAYANKNYILTSFQSSATESARAVGSGANGRFQVKNINMSNCSKLFKIGEYAFYNTFAERVLFPTAGSITSIEKGAFQECTRLSIIDNFGAQKIETIPYACFYNCGTNGTGIGAEEAIDGIRHPVVLPSTIKSIGDYAFYNCKQMMLLDGALAATKLKTIGNYSFYNCFSYAPNPDIARIALYVSLSIVTVIAGVVTAGAGAAAIIGAAIGTAAAGTLLGELTLWGGGFNDAWKDEQAYADIAFPYVTSIGKYCFAEGKLLKSMVLGPITEIPEGAFYNCNSLEMIAFHNGTDKMESASEVTGYPSKVTKIGKKAFAKCSSLEYGDLNYILSNVVRIEDEAFFKCKKLGEGTLFLPPSLTYLGEKSLDITGGVTIRFLGSTPPTMHSNVFGDTLKSKITCYVPTGSKNAYKTAFNGQVRDAKIFELTLTSEERDAFTAAGYKL